MEERLSKNPYDWININKDKSRTGIDKYLTFEEFKKIKESPMPTLCLEKVRDLFVFQTYTCLRYSDLAAFDSNRIQKINGMPVYLGDSIKTTKRFTIPLLTPAIEILNKYNGKLPIISNVKYNLYLKNVAQAAGIDKALSTHWARHTGATMLLNEGAEMNNKETGETFKSCIFTDNAENRCFVAFSSKMGELSPREIVAMKDELQVVQLESGNYSLCKVGQNAWEDVDLGL